MRVVRQILVGLGLIVFGVGAVVTFQGVIAWTQPGSSSVIVESVATTVLGALLLVAGVVLLVKGARKRPPAVSGNGA